MFYHELTWESLLQTLRDSVKDITVITIILAFSGVFGYGIVFDNITVTIANALLGITSNSAILLLLVVVFLLICGMFMETTVIALILTPILLPVSTAMGIDPIHFGMFMCLTLCLGGLTPPVGLCLITTSRIVDVDIDKMFPDLLWCIGIYVLVIALVAVFPGLATWLPSMMAYAEGSFMSVHQKRLSPTPATPTCTSSTRPFPTTGRPPPRSARWRPMPSWPTSWGPSCMVSCWATTWRHRQGAGRLWR